MRLVTRLARPRLVWLMSATLAKKSSSRDGDLLASRFSAKRRRNSLFHSLSFSFLSLSLSLSLSFFLFFFSLGRTDVRQRTKQQRLGAFTPTDFIFDSTITPELRDRPRTRLATRFIVVARQSHPRRASIRLALRVPRTHPYPANALHELQDEP